MIVTRPTPDRLPEALALLQASDEAIWGASDWTESDLREDWERIDLDRDAWLIELDGRLAGVAQLLDRRGARFIGDAYVHPELTGRGVGALVVQAARGARRTSSRPSGRPTGLSSSSSRISSGTTAPRALPRPAASREHAASSGWSPMSAASIPTPEWPEGVELRPLDLEAHGRELHAAQEETFAREWGHVARTYEDWRERAFVIPRIDPALVPVVWAATRSPPFRSTTRNGTATGAGSGCSASASAGAGEGSVSRCSASRSAAFAMRARRPWRSGVDAENPTGATRLYDRAGMRVLWQADVWEKQLVRVEAPRGRSATIAG